MALRPVAPEPVHTAANSQVQIAEEDRPANAPPPVSPQPEAPPVARTLRDESVEQGDRFAKTEAAETETATLTREQAFAQPAEPSAASAQSDVAPPAALPQAAIAQTTVAPAPAETQGAQLPVPLSQTQTITITEEVPAIDTSGATAGGALSGQRVTDLPLNGRNIALLNTYAYTFASPDGAVQWRVGVAGSIKKSTDRSRTWQPQASGLTEDLLAGSAATSDVAWVVGRRGVILRTTDGQRWERIPGPPGVTSEWVAVAAYDALSATVIAADQRRYTTRDGGQAWILQQ
jgi:hypothetical protein